MTKIVSLQALKAIRPRWAERAETLVEGLVAKGRFEAVQALAEIYPMMVFPDTISSQHERRERLLDYAAATFNAFGPCNALSRLGKPRPSQVAGPVAA